MTYFLLYIDFGTKTLKTLILLLNNEVARLIQGYAFFSFYIRNTRIDSAYPKNIYDGICLGFSRLILINIVVLPAKL